MPKLKDYLAVAEQSGFAIGAFNVSNLETFKAVVQAAVHEQSPAIIESSDGETNFVGAHNLVDLVRNAREETGLPIFLNLDHSRTFDHVNEAIEAGYDLVHFDGSKESHDKNLATLSELVPRAHAKGICVEGEQDYIIEGSEIREMSAEQGREQSQLTRPEEAAHFVKQSGLDILAVSIGNVHGLYTTPKKLDIDLLKKIRALVPSFLSLHGGSGISEDQIREAIQVGKIVKINISTELRQALREGLLEGLKAHPDEVAMYKITPDAITKVQDIVQQKMKLFGSSGKASLA